MRSMFGIGIVAVAFPCVVTAQVTQRVNLSSEGMQTEAHTQDLFVSISADGRYVAFDNPSAVLVSGDTNGVRDVFVRDRSTGETTRVSTGPNGIEGNAASGYPSLSSSGRFVTLSSRASNL